MQNPSHRDTVNVEDASAQRHIGLLLFDGVEELDAVGPWEVLAYWTRHHPEDGWAISCLSAGGGRRHRREEPRPGRPPLPRGCPGPRRPDPPRWPRHPATAARPRPPRLGARRSAQRSR